MDGILVINKPAGMTSFDVIARLRKQYKQKKFGHAGTLDPMASGVLVVLAGRACKLLPFLKDTDKEYIARCELGASYDTDDITGKLEAIRPVTLDFDVQSLLDSFKGEQHQLVPKAAAKKVDGKKLYEYLREGKEVPKVYSDITIYDIRALDAPQWMDDFVTLASEEKTEATEGEAAEKEQNEQIELEERESVQKADFSFWVSCSSGTYVRSICRDFGEKSGNLAAMSALQRTKANGFTIEEAEDLEAPEHTLYPMDRLLDLPKVDYEAPDDIRNGKTIHFQSEYDQVLMMDGNEVLAIYTRKFRDRDLFSCTRGLWQ